MSERARTARITMGLWRRFRRTSLKLRFPQAHWGRGCDIRLGLRLALGEGGNLRIGEEVVMERDATLECNGELVIGARSIFGHHCTIAAKEKIEIGHDCLIAEMVSIRDHDHAFDDYDTPVMFQGSVCAPVRIGNNVWLAARVVVVKGVTIGDNAIVGAGAVVTKDIPSGAIAVGVPARVVKMRPGAPTGRPQERQGEGTQQTTESSEEF